MQIVYFIIFQYIFVVFQYILQFFSINFVVFTYIFQNQLGDSANFTSNLARLDPSDEMHRCLGIYKISLFSDVFLIFFHCVYKIFTFPLFIQNFHCSTMFTNFPLFHCKTKFSLLHCVELIEEEIQLAPWYLTQSFIASGQVKIQYILVLFNIFLVYFYCIFQYFLIFFVLRDALLCA